MESLGLQAHPFHLPSDLRQICLSKPQCPHLQSGVMAMSVFQGPCEAPVLHIWIIWQGGGGLKHSPAHAHPQRSCVN